MHKSILIFGAGLNQVTLIKAANELGLSSVVLDPSQDPPGKSYADFFYCVKGNDYESTKQLALKHSVKGIVTSQMEKPLRLMARLAEELGFIFNSPGIIEKSLDKYLMKEAFLRNRVPCAAGQLFGADEEITREKLKKLKYPLIIKPKDATSSQGVYKIDSFNEITKYINATRAFSKTGEVIVEEFLDGPELSVEAVTFKGKTTIVQFTEKFITPFPLAVEMGHLQPAALNENERRVIGEIVMRAISALGIDNSASHTEVKLTKEGPKIIEIGARLGGDFIASYLTLYSCGVNMDKVAIQIALGKEPDLEYKIDRYSYIKYFDLKPGKRVKEIGNWDEMLNKPEVVFAHLSLNPGDIIAEITESAKRPGFVIVESESKEDVLKTSEENENFIKEKIILE